MTLSFRLPPDGGVLFFPSASGLVVKFNVAIVEPPVRFRACASAFLNFIGIIDFLNIISIFQCPQNPFNQSCLKDDELGVRIYYVRMYRTTCLWTAQVSEFYFYS